MQFTVIHSTLNCADSTCPTIYQTEDGSYVFQGFKVEEKVKADHQVPAGEDMIQVPKEFIDAFLGKQKA